jgi:2-methylisocitrate lyase-like PEP mutase family enzyme
MPMTTQSRQGDLFYALHCRDRAFVIPNPWDVGSARLLAQLGFEALATTSAGFAFAAGRRDGSMGLASVLAHAGRIVTATPLPVSADLENGFGDAPAIVADTITSAAAVGLVGGSIEDASGRSDDPIYELGLATERVQAAVEAARALPFRFTLTARAENYLHGRADLADTIRRLQAYQEAGADVLYAPGLARREDIVAVVSSVDRPVNVLVGSPGMRLTLDELSLIGVKRVSVGSALARAAYGALLRAAFEMRDLGTFSSLDGAPPFRTLNDMFNP